MQHLMQQSHQAQSGDANMTNQTSSTKIVSVPYLNPKYNIDFTVLTKLKFLRRIFRCSNFTTYDYHSRTDAEINSFKCTHDQKIAKGQLSALISDG